jgi:hypothetical protein
MPDCFVRVKVLVENWMLQLVDLTAMGPVIVETVPELTVIVPPSCPVHVG